MFLIKGKEDSFNFFLAHRLKLFPNPKYTNVVKYLIIFFSNLLLAWALSRSWISSSSSSSSMSAVILLIKWTHMISTEPQDCEFYVYVHFRRRERERETRDSAQGLWS